MNNENIARKITVRPLGGAVIVTIPKEFHERLGCEAHRKSVCVLRGTKTGLNLEFFKDPQIELLDVSAKKKTLDVLPLFPKKKTRPVKQNKKRLIKKNRKVVNK